MEIKLFDKVTAILPESFREINREEQKKFFGSTVFEHAFAAENDRALIGMMRAETQLNDQDVEGRIAAYQQHYSRMVPGFSMGEMRKSDKIGRNVAFMTYKSNAPTKDIYNILALTTLDGKELLFLFSCDMKDSPTFMYQFLGVLESLRFENED